MPRLIVVACLVLAACASGEPAPASTTRAANTSTTFDERDVFVANLAEALGATPYADSVIEDPEPFVTTGLLMCRLLEEGSSPSEVLDQFLTGFGEEPGDDDSALAGALLGSAVNVFCPDFRQSVVDDLG